MMIHIKRLFLYRSPAYIKVSISSPLPIYKGIKHRYGVGFCNCSNKIHALLTYKAIQSPNKISAKPQYQLANGTRKEKETRAQ